MQSINKLLKASTGLVLAVAAIAPVVQVKADASFILINEVEADDAAAGNDWVEIINTGSEAVDISGWFVTDEKGLERLGDGETTPLADGTVLQPGEVMVLEEGVNFNCGLGKGGDAVILFDGAQIEKDSFTWNENAKGTWSRMEDGTFADAPATKGTVNGEVEPVIDVVINEVESNGDNTDWVEIRNNGNTAVDISGWYVTDDKGVERVEGNETTPLKEGTILAPGAYYVFDGDSDFTFGLGKEDTVTVYQKDGTVVAEYSWNGHAAGTYARIPDGTGEFVDVPVSSKGTENKEAVPSEGKLVLNEINSNPDDWVEVMNTGGMDLDISGYELRDNADDHRWKFPDGTVVKAGEIYLVDAKDMGLVYDDNTDTYVSGTFEAAIGIGSGDSMRLFDAQGTLLDSYSWSEHAAYDGDNALASYGRYPDGTGAFCLMKETKGQPNDWYRPAIEINEVESNGDATDWVEVINTGDTSVDLSGWYVLDNDPVGHASETTPLPDGTMLEPGALYVFDGNKDFAFGLGDGDTVTLYAPGGAVVAEYSWNVHASGVYARIPDGTGEFVDTASSTKGRLNIVMTPVVINEVQSNDPEDGPDWIELANPTGEALDISGIVVKDSDDDHAYTIPQGTTIDPYGFLVIEEGENGFDFGLGKGDSVRLFEDGNLIASTTWNDHTNPTWGLYPDVNGTEYRNTLVATKGEANRFAGIPETTQWNGSGEVVTIDNDPTFLEDSSGLDFHKGQLYAVDNGTATFWIMDVNEDGSIVLSPVSSYRVRYEKDAGDTTAAGPDAEGITVDGEGNVYIASERDNSDKGTNYNSILMAETANADAGGDIIASKEWELNDLLPSVSANMGIEAVEWVENADVEGRLIDQNTNAVYDSSRYPNAVGNGLFFVALEDNGHVYAFVLNEDETAVLVADIDPKLGGAMALDYDTYENVLYVAADNGYGNRMAMVSFNGTNEPLITHILPPSGLDVNANYEGFALADVTYADNGNRPVYRFQDGVTSGALSEMWMTHTHDFTSSGYQYDETGHYHVCSCGEKGSVEAHTFGDWTKISERATTVTQVRTCSVCGYKETREINVPADHTEHTYGTTYSMDENGHWLVCTVCGEKGNVAAHTFGAWKKVDNGNEERVCDVCGYKETRKITAASPSVSTGNYIDPLPWVIILVSCSLVLVGGTIYRKKKENKQAE